MIKFTEELKQKYAEQFAKHTILEFQGKEYLPLSENVLCLGLQGYLSVLSADGEILNACVGFKNE